MSLSTKRLALMLAALLSAAPAFADKSEDEAGDVSEVDKDSAGPLRERIRPVSGHQFLMGGRFEVSPGISLSLRDAFFNKVVLGAAFTYHFTDHIGLGIRAGYALSYISTSAQICTQGDGAAVQAGCRLPTLDELTKENGVSKNRAYGLWTLAGSVDFQWAPIYGKLSLSAESFLGFNMYALVGPSIVMYGPKGDLAPGANVGIGFRWYFNKWLALRTELRDVIYYEEGSPNGSLRNQLLFEAGFSMFFPTLFKEN